MYARRTEPGSWTGPVAREGPNRLLDSDRCHLVAKYNAHAELQITQRQAVVQGIQYMHRPYRIVQHHTTEQGE